MAKTLFDRAATAIDPDLAARLEDACAGVARRVAASMISGELAARDQRIANLEARIARLERQLAAVAACGAVQ